MKKLLVRLLLLSLLLGLLFTQAQMTPTVRADSNCGDPYIRHGFDCTLWGWWCWDTQEACADCDGGTHCYPMDN